MAFHVTFAMKNLQIIEDSVITLKIQGYLYISAATIIVLSNVSLYKETLLI